MQNKTLIIAEAGVNHNGSLDLAKQMINVASEAGVDFVKFQTFKTELCISVDAPKAEYQIENTNKSETQYEMVKKLELSENDHLELIAYCNSKSVRFLSTPFDLISVNFLNSLDIDFFKIPSGEITNLPYLRAVGKLSKKVIMSTGMADLNEIASALYVIIDAGTPRSDITLLHCTTEYPASIEGVNLSAMNTLAEKFHTAIGYSDHTIGIEIPIAAVAMGATVIEKHFTLDRNMEGPDHKASLEPDELKAMVSAIRNVQKALGDGVKVPLPVELEIRKVARKSIVAKKKISKGDVLTDGNLTVKRPGTGVSPMKWNLVIGTIALKDYSPEELIEIK